MIQQILPAQARGVAHLFFCPQLNLREAATRRVWRSEDDVRTPNVPTSETDFELEERNMDSDLFEEHNQRTIEGQYDQSNPC